MDEWNVKKVKQYLKKLEKLGIDLDIEDVMTISHEDVEEIGFTIDGIIVLKKDNFFDMNWEVS